jgi:ABC-type sugar transport system ATPase subunit
MPADLFVAQFVGSPRINVIRGELSSEDGTPVFIAGNLKNKILQNIHFPGKQIIGTIRPEDIAISKEEVDGWLKTKTYSVLPAGSETIIAVENDLTLSVKINGFTDIKMDDMVWIRLDPGKMNYYDPQTEKLIRAE